MLEEEKTSKIKGQEAEKVKASHQVPEGRTAVELGDVAAVILPVASIVPSLLSSSSSSFLLLWTLCILFPCLLWPSGSSELDLWLFSLIVRVFRHARLRPRGPACSCPPLAPSPPPVHLFLPVGPLCIPVNPISYS